MSYMRMGCPLKYFKGESKSYVYYDVGNFVEDYNDRYTENASFCELIGTLVSRATHNDEKYARKIMKILAKKLRVSRKLRKKPLTTEQLLKMIDVRLKRIEP